VKLLSEKPVEDSSRGIYRYDPAPLGTDLHMASYNALYVQ
jgi:hypothetical protein